MLKRLTLSLIACMIALSVVSAQTNEPQSTINFTVFICEDRAVVSFNGFMQAGFDIYYQIFNAANVPLTPLRQVNVSGNYSFSESVRYDNNQTVPFGGAGYMTVSIARETDPSRSIFSSRANDIQDGCVEPPPSTGGSSANVGGITTGDDTAPGAALGTPNTILSPFGGFLNPDYTPRRPPLVTIGARDPLPVRQQTAGLVFAECNQYPVAFPGLIYDTDDVTVFWSWFASTPELVQEHIDNAIYEVGYFGSNPFIQPVQVSEIQQRGRLFWVFYTIPLGKVKPGFYTVSFRLSWREAISDGFEEFGPGTENERIISNCDFRVFANPEGSPARYNFP